MEDDKSVTDNMEDDKSVPDNMEDDMSVTVTTWKMTRVRL
jgi:hypothetical protein